MHLVGAQLALAREEQHHVRRAAKRKQGGPVGLAVEPQAGAQLRCQGLLARRLPRVLHKPRRFEPCLGAGRRHGRAGYQVERLDPHGRRRCSAGLQTRAQHRCCHRRLALGCSALQHIIRHQAHQGAAAPPVAPQLPRAEGLKQVELPPFEHQRHGHAPRQRRRRPSDCMRVHVPEGSRHVRHALERCPPCIKRERAQARGVGVGGQCSEGSAQLWLCSAALGLRVHPCRQLAAEACAGV